MIPLSQVIKFIYFYLYLSVPLIQVVYIDFGNSEVVPLKDIDFRPFRVNLPQQSLCCKLHGITTVSEKYLLSF